MVVAVFVLCIALGSFVVSALPRIPRALLPAALWVLLILLVALYREVDTVPYWAYELRSLFRDQDAAFYPYFLSAFAGLLLLIGVPVALSGSVLPLMFHALRERVGDLGDVAGRLYAWNTLGSLLGALLGGYALLYWLDLHHVYRIAMAAIAIAGAVALGLGSAARSRRIGDAVLLALTFAAIAALPAWRTERMNAGLFREPAASSPFTFRGADLYFANHPLVGGAAKFGNAKWIFHRDDPTSTVTVIEQSDEDGRLMRTLRTSGRVEGGIHGSDTTMRLAGLLPALFAEKLERAFVIGYGLGMTVGELASIGTVREVLVAEISPGVIEAAPLFDYGNNGASKHPAVHITTSDAYRALLRSEGRFDAIVSTPSVTWVAGVEMLFSREFLEAVRDRLEPGGVYVQWFHANGFPPGTQQPDPTSLALRTFASVFPHLAVWYGDAEELLIVGLMDDRRALDLDALESRSRSRDLEAGLARAEIRGLGPLLAHELLPIGVVNAARLPDTIHTLLRPRLGYLSARAFFTNYEGVLPSTADLETARIGQRNSLQQRYAARFGGRLPEIERGKLVAQICLHRPRECQTQMAAWTRDVPESAARAQVMSTLSAKSKGKIDFKLVPQLLPLYGVAAPDAGRTSAEDARKATDLFVSFYAHAEPFSRRALADLWRRCEIDPAQRDACRSGRAEADARLGLLETALASDGSP
jgi:spermidine synthase